MAERTEILSMHSVRLYQYSRGSLSPTDVMRFPWDDDSPATPSETWHEPEPTREELKERYRAAKAAAGLTYLSPYIPRTD
ncbi:MAG: hypothetical protein NC342_00695 [Pseudoflavonifractor sp.]|nr:hypothetical protein [Alloprevotella sp.]MCM1116044.1 hypothetical protein [Pseudoflavonifractor sp.]